MDWPVWIETAQAAATTLALVSAGTWTYFHYLRGRTYRPSLELGVDGRVVEADGVRYVIATVRCENVGLSKIDLQQKGTGLRVFGYDSRLYANAPESFFGVMPGHLGTVPVFTKYRWLEPKEQAVDEWLLVVPVESSAFQLDLRVTTGERAWRRLKVIPVSGELQHKPTESEQLTETMQRR